jgi:hypothetical protein
MKMVETPKIVDSTIFGTDDFDLTMFIVDIKLNKKSFYAFLTSGMTSHIAYS